MDTVNPDHNSEPDQCIASLINEFFDRRHAGEDLTAESFAAEHPELAEELRPYLDGLTLLDRVRVSETRVMGEEGRTLRLSTELPSVAGYELISEIGRGGMGVVYKALQVSTKRIVALKVMLVGQFASASARRRFEREVELAARLQHPHIVGILESGQVDGQPYYAMEFVSGLPLDRYLADVRPDERAVVMLFANICDAVHDAHQHGVIHRDLKPANVLFDETGQPHILDFGLAKATDRIDSDEEQTIAVSLPGQVMGTLSYLSPEQAAGLPGEIDSRTDVYALGVLLFESMTGSLPVDTSGRPSEVVERILEVAPTRPSSLVKGVSSDLETIMLKALRKDREDRYASAAAMAEDIRRFVEGEPICARRPSSLYVIRKKLVKHHRRAALLAALVVAALLVVLLSVQMHHRDLAHARSMALRYQQDTERGHADVTIAPASVLAGQYPHVPEARLVYAQAQYRDVDARPFGVKCLEKWLVRNEAHSWAFQLLLSECYRVAGEVERADDLHAQAQRDVPDTADAWYLRSFATLDLNHALHCASEAVERKPDYELAWDRLTYLSLATGDLDGAVGAVDRLIDLSSDPTMWMIFKGHILVRQGQLEQAVEQYTAVCEAGSLYRAHVYRRLGEYEKAVADYTFCIEREGDTTVNVWYLYQRATPLWILGRVEEALDDCQRVRSLLARPVHSDARRVIILRDLGRDEEAQKILDVAMADVAKPSWLYRIFRCLAGEMTPEQLVEDGTARNDVELLCEAYYYAGEVYLQSGSLSEAKECFERCVQTGLQYDPDTELNTPMNEYELAVWRLRTVLSEG